MAKEFSGAIAWQFAEAYRQAVLPSDPKIVPMADCINTVQCVDSTQVALPPNTVGLAFTSPPYNVQKEYDANLGLADYLDLIKKVGANVYRSLIPGGRYVVNVANVGRRPYIPMTSMFYEIHMELGFMPIGEIIWQKAQGAGGNCAWGSWRSSKAPSLRDIHEYLLVFTKEGYGRKDSGTSSLTSEQFMESTLSVWNIRPESAKRVGHPAPFPLALAERVINLYSYLGDVVLDPFAGSGTTCLAAKRLGRNYVGFEINEGYCALAKHRLDGGNENKSNHSA
ncbi:MAG TPA: site-specific DNA-methyltransferase [Anaerolineaceae bacterium]|nr:site-specific DNA-methyltransferase [Myxococcota bacterium]HRS74680.1 site-specific DNA-methyltransferase [Anaerolineaceae bacterium]HRV18448.1 site-specific DNA-methyltransferase [Myxococcota bacterium]